MTHASYRYWPTQIGCAAERAPPETEGGCFDASQIEPWWDNVRGRGRSETQSRTAGALRRHRHHQADRTESSLPVPRSCRMRSMPGLPNPSQSQDDITIVIKSTNINLRKHGVTHSLNSLSFLFRNANGLSSGRQWGVLIGILAEQLQELIWILANQLCKLWISGAYLLQNRLEHAWLCLHYLTQLLELWISSKKIKITKSACASFATGSSGCSHPKPFTEET